MPQQGKKGRKIDRSKRKAAARVKPLSQFIRGLITAEQYFKQTSQKSGK
jgi:hypothetical protein